MALDVFAALADPTRREILRLLADRSLTAGEIAASFPQQRPAISKHISSLKAAGLLLEQRERQCRIYSLNAKGLEVVGAFVRELQRSSVEQPDVRDRAGETGLGRSLALPVEGVAPIGPAPILPERVLMGARFGVTVGGSTAEILVEETSFEPAAAARSRGFDLDFD